ncbi:MAG: hypothetical protein HOP19_28315 [Acidobacteria bacterium]|nr:hypothetical protein [Acidobacteriota bacterium]
MFYELISGSAPFTGASLTPYAARCEPALLKAICQMLEKDVTRRTATAHALLLALHQSQATAGRRSAAPLRQSARIPPAANDDWRMFSDFSKGFWQLAFNGGPAVFCYGLAVVAAAWAFYSLVTLVASAR